MSVKEYLCIVLEILRNWKVIATVVAMLLIIAFSNFVVKYKRKAKKGKKKKIAAAPEKPQAAPTPAPAESSASLESPDSIGGN